jgi:hypothetical protein
MLLDLEAARIKIKQVDVTNSQSGREKGIYGHV